MIQDMQQQLTGFGWILPVTRIVNELGARVMWETTVVTLSFPDGQKVECHEDGGLTFVPWESFRKHSKKGD